MAKRFTDTDKWKRKWFRSLSNDHKVFWQFILDQCNHAGIWDVDFEFASIFCGCLMEDEIRKIFEKQFKEIDGGKRWFIKDFIDFQYGSLNANNNLHKSVINILEKQQIEPLKSPSTGAMVKDKVKDKVIKGVIGGFDFESIWVKYPNKLGKKHAERHFNSSVKTDVDFLNIQKAITNFLDSRIAKGDPQYIPHGSTWFHGWKDWIDYSEPKTVESELIRKKRELGIIK